jgi:hypothetical protein
VADLNGVGPIRSEGLGEQRLDRLFRAVGVETARVSDNGVDAGGATLRAAPGNV